MQIGLPASALARIAPPPAAPDNAAADAAGGDFANLLQQQAEPAATADAAEERPDTPAAPGRDTRPRAPARTTARVAERPAAPEVGPKAESAAEVAEATAPLENTPERGLLDWLAALHLPAPATPSADATTAATTGATPAADAAAPLASLATDTRPLAGGRDADAALQGVGAQRSAARDKASLGTQRLLAAATDSAESASARGAPEAGRFSIEGLANLRSGPSPEATPQASPLATAAPTPQNTASTTAPVTVPLATPLDDPQFPRAFGVQVSVLARDGVQQAELHLNPAEMGPVSVQIVMEGTQARIDFGADAAGTRQLIEHSLPDLAAALREAGLTLTGGGVSQHPSGRGDGDDRTPTGPQPDAATSAAEASAQPLRRTVRAGGVDLYA